MFRFKALVSIILVISVVFLSSCLDSVIGKESELLIGVENIGYEFNPLYCENETDKMISSQIFGYVQIQGTDNSLINSCGGISYEYVGENQVKYTVTLRDDMFFSDGKNVTVEVTAGAKAAPAPKAAPAAGAGEEQIVSPLPGTIVRIDVSAGSTVAAGDVLAVIEAMKMETEIRAEKAGTVIDVLVNPKDVVTAEQPIIIIGDQK